jgi:hypothetical protein
VASSSTDRADLISSRTGVLVMRAWIEPEHPTSLRVRIVQSMGDTIDDLAGTEALSPATTMAATIEDAVRIVRAWLDVFVGP